MAESKTNEKANGQEKAGRSAAESQGAAAESGSRPPEDARGIDLLLDVPLQVSVEVGRARMRVKDFLQMKEGGIIELDKLADEPLDLYVNSRLIARGEAVVVNEKFGLRLIDVVSTSERLEKLR
jgi:flagellar motor switch protein FliN/FliY